MLLSIPVQSSASESCIPAASLICSATSSGFAVFSICTVLTVGTSFLANSSLDGKRSVITMGVQPAAWAARRVTSPIGPAPLSNGKRAAHETKRKKKIPKWEKTYQITIGSPSLTPALSRPANATARGSHKDPSS